MTTAQFKTVSDLPERIPIFPLAGAVLFPGSALPLNIFEPRYLNMLDDARASDNVIGMVQSLPSGSREHPDVAKIGCLGLIDQFRETEDARYLIVLRGVCRFSIAEELNGETPYRMVQADWSNYSGDLEMTKLENPALQADLLDEFEGYLRRNGLGANLASLMEATLTDLINILSSGCPFSVTEKQDLLESDDLKQRCGLLRKLLKHSGGTFSGGPSTHNDVRKD